MKKIILSTMLVLTLFLALSVLSISAAIPGYGIFVGGVEVTESNAADVLGDGTVSYDAATNTLTLNNANITEYYETKVNQGDIKIAVYSEISDLKINLVGNNIITFENYDDDDTAVAIFSAKKLEISGTGKLSTKAWSGVGAMDDILIKDCEATFYMIGVTSIMGDVTIDGATVGSTFALVGLESGDIYIKNTTVTDGGYMMLSTQGAIEIEDSNLTTNSMMAIVFGNKPLTIRNSVIDLAVSEFGISSMSGKVILDGVSGKVKLTGEHGYAIMSGSLEMKNCDLEISCVTSKDMACGIATASDIVIKSSKLQIDVSAQKESAICIAGMEESGVNVTVEDSELILSASGPNAAGFWEKNVKLINSTTRIEAFALPDAEGIAMGIYSEIGRVVVQGGLLDILVNGPTGEGKSSCCIVMDNAALTPEFINCEVKLRGNRSLETYPDLSMYTKNHGIFASNDVSGDGEIDFTKENLEVIRFLHIYPLHAISFDGNGGVGEMVEPNPWYGEYILPEVGYEAPAGKQFKGWALSKDGEILTGTSFIPTDDTVLYAIWEDIPGSGNEGGNGGAVIDPDHVHSFGAEWTQGESTHYKACACGAKQHEGMHADSNANGSCDVCGAQLTEEADGGLGTGAIIGIVAGSVAVVGIGGFAIYWFVIRKKKLA